MKVSLNIIETSVIKYVNDHICSKLTDARIASLEMEKALLEANAFTDKKSLEMYTYFDTWRRQHEAEQNAMFTQQAVYNATNTANIGCMQKQIDQLYSMTKLIIPASSVCPQPMPLHNSWQTPTATPAA